MGRKLIPTESMPKEMRETAIKNLDTQARPYIEAMVTFTYMSADHRKHYRIMLNAKSALEAGRGLGPCQIAAVWSALGGKLGRDRGSKLSIEFDKWVKEQGVSNE